MNGATTNLIFILRGPPSLMGDSCENEGVNGRMGVGEEKG
jgi:hypothetical protein